MDREEARKILGEMPEMKVIGKPLFYDAFLDDLCKFIKTPEQLIKYVTEIHKSIEEYPFHFPPSPDDLS